MNMNIDRSVEILDLHKDGYDAQSIARKLEIALPEVENVVFGQVKEFSHQDANYMMELLHFGAHY
jgi:hypothetical protein